VGPSQWSQSSKRRALNCSTRLRPCRARTRGRHPPGPARRRRPTAFARPATGHTAQERQGHAGRLPQATDALIRILSREGSSRAPQAEPPPARRGRAPRPSRQKRRPKQAARIQANSAWPARGRGRAGAGPIRARATVSPSARAPRGGHCPSCRRCWICWILLLVSGWI